MLIRTALSAGAEVLLAVPFGLNRLWFVAAVNVATQLALWAFMGYGGLAYMPALVIGEICVYLVEYIAYLLMFKAKSRLRLAAYTLTA
ncbi:MAG: hypothetical protein LBI44_08420, partial [Oscillospiraceae bacterium]|nr:hypothetical protein [Oscillospiraceae bacterium]